MVDEDVLTGRASPFRHGIPLPTPEAGTDLQFEPALGTVWLAADSQGTFPADIGLCSLPILAASAHAATPLTVQLRGFSQDIETHLNPGRMTTGPPVRVGQQLATLEARWEQAAAGIGPVVRALTDWTLSSLLDDTAFGTRLATDYAAGYDAVSRDWIAQRCGALAEQAADTAVAPAYRGVLDGLTTAHSRMAASVVAELSLWYSLDISSAETAASLPTTEDIVQRARDLADGVDTIAPGEGELSRHQLREVLVETVEIDIAPLDRSWADGSALLSSPADTNSDVTNTVHPEHLTDSTGPLAWLLTLCLSQAPLAGAVYSQGGRCDYLVNPWVAEPSGSTYRETWERAIACSGLAGQLCAAAASGDQETATSAAQSGPTCPVCACRTTASSECRCANIDIVEAAQSHWAALQEGAGTRQQ